MLRYIALCQTMSQYYTRLKSLLYELMSDSGKNDFVQRETALFDLDCEIVTTWTGGFHTV